VKHPSHPNWHNQISPVAAIPAGQVLPPFGKPRPSLDSAQARFLLWLRKVLQLFPIRTEEKIVGKKNRLETVVWLRETEEDRARLAMADAQRHVAAATDALSAANARAKTDERRSASAAHWSLVETAHIRALQEARQAEHAVQAASDGLSQTRAHYLGAHTRTEALRRALQTRRVETVRAEAQAERKNMDEIAMLLRVATA
jgi:flagellar biosynthesis chaperone FliJ